MFFSKKSITKRLYLVKPYDLLSHIAGYYGVTEDQLKSDNNMENDGPVEYSIMFIRNPQQNQGQAMTPIDPADEQQKRYANYRLGLNKDNVYFLEPINMNTGNFYYNTEDFSMPDWGGKFQIARSYNAKAGVQRGPFGNRWNSNLNQFIAFMADHSVAYVRSDGSVIYFSKNSDGSYTAPTGESYTLEKIADGYKLTQKDQSTYYFAFSGILTAIEDRNGNRTQLNHDQNEQLTGIVSPAGKVAKLYKQADSNDETIQDAAPAEAEATTDSQTPSSEETSSGKLMSIFTQSSHSSKTSPAKKSTDVKTAPTDSVPADPTTADPAQSEDSEDVSYNYDIMGSRTVMDGPEGETGYSYDKMERLTSVSLPTAEEVTYDYDQLGRKSKLIYPGGKYVKYTYDALDRLTSATDWEGQKTLYSYDPNGRRVETVLPNGAKVSYSYDENDQLIKLESIGADDSIISSFEYSYDQAGNITKEIQTQTGSVYTRTYTYDAADEVIGFTEQSDQELKTYSYTYDKVGNRLTEDITGNSDTKHLTYDYNEGDELTLKSHDSDRDRYDYDKNGNVIRSTTQGNQVTSYDYNSENRLLQITEQQGKIQTFGYDSDGNRLYKTVGVYWQEPTEPGPIKTTPPPQGNGNGNGKDKGNNGNPGQGNGQDKKLSNVQSNTSEYYRVLMQ